MSSLVIGKKAPLFKLRDQNSVPVALSDFLGQYVVVYFYPKAMTPGCTTQACSLRDFKSELKKRNIVILGISPDSPERLKKFEERDKLNFTLLSDEGNEIAKKYNSYGLKKFMGKEYEGVLRQSFIIGKKGELLHILDKVNTKTHHDDVISYIDSLDK